ncbi:hypothetical protein Bca52824_033253 [Brassica carinata]|uniref:Uncharacterized protein n=1 Tax=Brassica carinata TaxID=52824 RepID=A0A8X7SEP0_BRACI|nr:hypothetical protein Bca52824_033253 [Brassica carinata]
MGAGGGSLSSVGQSCSNSNKHAREPMFEQLSKDIPAPGSNMRSGLEDINEDAATSDPWRSSDTQNSTDGKLLSQLSDSVKSESSCWRPGSSISRNPENSATSSPSSRPILSPRSSIGSYLPMSLSFKPSPTATRPRSPLGAAFAGQHPVMYNNTPQQLGPNQTYHPPNGPQYPQQRIIGQQRPVLFMPPSPYQPVYCYLPLCIPFCWGRTPSRRS